MKKPLFISIVLILMISACKPIATPTPIVEPLSTLTATPIILPTSTSTPLPTPTETLIPAFPQPDYSSTVYLDDRSSAAALIYSLVNAFNRHEFIRVYSYWSDAEPYLGTLDAFSNNYANLVSMQVNIGNIYGDGAAGSIYYLSPAVLTLNNADGSVARLAACFTMRLPQPGNYDAPPIQPLHIEKSQLVVYDSSLVDGEVMAKACDGTGYNVDGNGNPPDSNELENLTDLSAMNYIDNRSNAVEVVSSLFNALNRKEYVRAYSYWEDPAIMPGNYDAYAAGFIDTVSITATFGEVISEAGAGQFYYMLPVAEVVKTTTGTTQTYVGCYTLHLSNPGIQGTLPFEPLGIKEGHFELVDNGVNTTPLLAAACN